MFPILAFVSQYHEPSAAGVEQAVKSFHFCGSWISPKLVHEFVPWESDHTMPIIHSLDVGAAVGTNRYFGKMGNGPKGSSLTEGDGVTLDYDWVGRLRNGMHVLVMRESGSGTMVATDLLIVSLRPAWGYKENGSKYRQLLMTLERSAILGDRAVPIVTLQGNTIHVKSEFNTKRAPEEKTISFD